MLLSCVDWDPYMAQYNITHIPEEKLDKQFLLWLSDHALPVLIQHKEIFINGNVSPAKSDALHGRSRSAGRISLNFAQGLYADPVRLKPGPVDRRPRAVDPPDLETEGFGADRVPVGGYETDSGSGYPQSVSPLVTAARAL